MGQTWLHLLIISTALFLGLLSLIIGKSFIRRRDSLNAVDTLWYVNLALVLCLGLSVYVMYSQAQDLEDLQDKLQKIQDSQ
jgi:hypothetical protein